jgi:hypothetical protein
MHEGTGIMSDVYASLSLSLPSPLPAAASGFSFLPVPRESVVAIS